MRLLESLLQRFQLLRGESRAAAALFAVLRAVASLQDDVLKCAAVGEEAHMASLFNYVMRYDTLMQHEFYSQKIELMMCVVCV